MDRQQLAEAITAADEDDWFVIRDEPNLESMPDNVTVMEPEADGSGWTVFFVERLEKVNPEHFDTEEAACDYMYSLLMDG